MTIYVQGLWHNNIIKGGGEPPKAKNIQPAAPRGPKEARRRAQVRRAARRSVVSPSEREQDTKPKPPNGAERNEQS